MTAGHRKTCLLVVVADGRPRRRPRGYIEQRDTLASWEGPREQDTRAAACGGGRWVIRKGHERT